MSWFEHGTSRIYYEEQGAGDPVLLLPGFGEAGEALSAVRALLAAEYRVIAADLPGSGRSQPQPREYTATYLEDDARSFAALLRQLAVGPSRLVGFSDGGEVSLLMAALAPDVARSVAAWGAAGLISDPDGSMRAMMRNVIEDPPPPLREYSDYLKATYGADNARAMTRSFAAALDDIIERRGGDISLSKAGDIACPVLLINGELDMFAPPALATQYAARLRMGELLEAKGAGHGVHDEQPEWFAEKLLGWLKQH